MNKSGEWTIMMNERERVCVPLKSVFSEIYIISQENGKIKIDKHIKNQIDSNFLAISQIDELSYLSKKKQHSLPNETI